MAAIIRFFSRRFRRQNHAPAPSHTEEVSSSNKTKKTKKSDLECQVSYLDTTNETFYLPKKSLGSALYDLAFAFVALNEEKDYFGLQFTDKIKLWLDPTKEIRKQCKGPPYLFALRVKFFASDPHNLRDEYVRYLVVLQLREDIRTGKLPCTDLKLAAELAALLLQGEFGDFDAKQHTPAFVSTFRFLPDDQQTEEFELAVLDEYRALAHRNLTPAATETIYLERVRLLPDYGVDMHVAKGKDNQNYSLGLTPTGILVYEGHTKIGLFVWNAIIKLEMRGNKLKILVNDEDEKNRKVTEYAFCFVLPDNRTCKALWKSAVEHHTFFRLTDRAYVPPKHKNFFRLRSRFHASFNTEYQMHNMNMFGSSSMRKRKPVGGSLRQTPTAPNSPIPKLSASTTSFRRVPSKRFEQRPSFAKRANLDERRAKHDRLLAARQEARAAHEAASAPGPIGTASTGSAGPANQPLIRVRSNAQAPATKPEPSYQFTQKVSPYPRFHRTVDSPSAPAKPPRNFNAPVNTHFEYTV